MPLNVITVVLVLLQTVWFETVLTEGVGLTIIVNVVGVPGQPFAIGVTVILAVTALAPTLTAVNAAILPVPLAAKPMLGVLFVQLYVVPVPLNVITVVLVLLQTVWSTPAFEVGKALLVITTSSVAGVHIPFETVHLKVAVVPATKPVTVVDALEGVVIVAVPLTNVHAPVPTEGAVAAIVKVEVLQSVWSTPAFEVGKALLVITTSSVAAGHVPLTTVQRNVAVPPAAKPVTVVVALKGLVIVAVPDTSVHVPVPAEGAVADIVKVEVLQSDWSTPALALGAVVFVKTTSSEDVQPL